MPDAVMVRARRAPAGAGRRSPWLRRCATLRARAVHMARAYRAPSRDA